MGTEIAAISPSVLNLVWLGLFLALLVIELLTVGLTTIWFAAGALAALAANIAGADLIVQIIVFLVVSVALLILTRPWAEKYLNRKREKTNYEREIGRIILITETVDNLNQTGKSVLDGVEWTVRAKNDSEIFEAGTRAKVADISGVKLIVEKCEEEK